MKYQEPVWMKREDVRVGDVVLNCRKGPDDEAYYRTNRGAQVVEHINVESLYGAQGNCILGNALYREVLAARPVAVNPVGAERATNGWANLLTGMGVTKPKNNDPVVKYREWIKNAPVLKAPSQVLYDGLSAKDCFQRFLDNMQETGNRRWKLTPAQKEVAQTMWSAQLKTRAAEVAEKERCQVVVDLDDDYWE